MKKHTRLELSRRDVQQIIKPGDVIVTASGFYLLLFWFEKDSEHFFVSCECDSHKATSVTTWYWTRFKNLLENDRQMNIDTLIISGDES